MAKYSGEFKHTSIPPRLSFGVMSLCQQARGLVNTKCLLKLLGCKERTKFPVLAHNITVLFAQLKGFFFAQTVLE